MFNRRNNPVDTACFDYKICRNPLQVDIAILVNETIVEKYMPNAAYICFPKLGYNSVFSVQVTSTFSNKTTLTEISTFYRTPYRRIQPFQSFYKTVISDNFVNVSWTIQKPVKGMYYNFTIQSKCFKNLKGLFTLNNYVLLKKKMFKKKCHRKTFLFHINTYRNKQLISSKSEIVIIKKLFKKKTL